MNAVDKSSSDAFVRVSGNQQRCIQCGQYKHESNRRMYTWTIVVEIGQRAGVISANSAFPGLTIGRTTSKRRLNQETEHPSYKRHPDFVYPHQKGIEATPLHHIFGDHRLDFWGHVIDSTPILSQAILLLLSLTSLARGCELSRSIALPNLVKIYPDLLAICVLGEALG